MDHEAGLAALEDAVGRSPTDAEAWSRLGEAYWGLEQYELASIAFRQATCYAPASAYAWQGLAANLVRLGEGAGGLAAARQAARALPQSPLARVCAGRALLLLDRPLEALVELEDAGRLSENSSMAIFERARTLSRLGWYEPAAATLEAALRIQPDVADAWVDLGAHLVALHRWEGAVRLPSQGGQRP